MSAGLRYASGYDGMGFNIFFQGSYIKAIVQTDNESYNVSYQRTIDNSCTSYIITWKKNIGLNLYVNGSLSVKDISPSQKNKTTSSQPEQAYFDIHHVGSRYLAANISKFVTWRRALTSNEVREWYKQVGMKIIVLIHA